MDRYGMAVHKNKVDPKADKALRYPFTASIVTAMKYIDDCRRQNAVLMADNIPLSVIESAVVKISQRDQIPIMVDTKDQARILSTVNSYPKGFCSKDNPATVVICYNSSIPTEHEGHIKCSISIRTI